MKLVRCTVLQWSSTPSRFFLARIIYPEIVLDRAPIGRPHAHTSKSGWPSPLWPLVCSLLPLLLHSFLPASTMIPKECHCTAERCLYLCREWAIPGGTGAVGSGCGATADDGRQLGGGIHPADLWGRLRGCPGDPGRLQPASYPPLAAAGVISLWYIGSKARWPRCVSVCKHGLVGNETQLCSGMG